MSSGGCMFASGHCIVCRGFFTFNPITVPSTSAFTGEREPICSHCIGSINTRRAGRGLPPWPVARDAYQCAEVSA